MGVLGATKPWPMSPPLNPADFPGYNPQAVPRTMVVTNFFPEQQQQQQPQQNLGEYHHQRNPSQPDYVLRNARNGPGGKLPLYETVRPKSAVFPGDLHLGKKVGCESPRIENEYSLSPRAGHLRQRSEVQRPPVPPPLPPNRPSSAHGSVSDRTSAEENWTRLAATMNRNEFSGLYPPQTPTCVPWLKKFKVIKKIKRKIGMGHGKKAGTSFNNLPPLNFHGVHGENVELFQEGSIARRINSFCKAIVFTDRAVKVNEKVCLRLIEVSNNWSGVVRFGFTNQDPNSLRNSLPKYVCPDLTSRPGFWAKAFSDQLVKKNIVLEFHVNSGGEIHFAIDGEDKGVFLTGVDTRAPLWAVMDIYGNTTAVELVDPRAHLNNSRPSLNSVESIPMKHLSSSSSEVIFHRGSSPYTPHQMLTSSMTSCSSSSIHPQYSPQCGNGSSQYRPQQQHMSACSSAPSLPPAPESPQILCGPRGQHQQRQSSSCGSSTSTPKSSSYLPAAHLVKSQVRESICGRGITGNSGLNAGSSSAGCSSSSSVSQYYHVQQVQQGASGCSNQALPAYKSPPKVACSNDYEVVYPKKNPGPSSYVSIPSLSKVHQESMDAVEKLASGMSKVSLKSSTVTCGSQSIKTDDTSSSSCLEAHDLSTCSNSSSSSGKDQALFSLECLACCERPVDSVFYSCGHMCMCFQCANVYMETKEKGHCPICRAPICDVIRTYT